MSKILALGVGAVLALAPTGTAFAAPAEFGTGLGKAYGNCQHSSATGSHKPLEGSAGKGNGGHLKDGVKAAPCVPVAEEVVVEEEVEVVVVTPPSTGYAEDIN